MSWLMVNKGHHEYRPAVCHLEVPPPQHQSGKFSDLGNVRLKSGLVVIFVIQMAKIRKLGICINMQSKSPG